MVDTWFETVAETLPAIAEAVGDRIEVLLDGGVRVAATS